jgi:hypothetical protein
VIGIASLSELPVQVTAAGLVTPLKADAAVGGQGTLTFQTGGVSIDTAGYAGLYRMGYASGDLRGAASLVLVKNMNYHVFIAGYGIAGPVAFAADGTLSTSSPSLAVAGSQLTFLTAPVTVDPSGYLGNYRLGYASNDLKGPTTTVLVVGLPYRVEIAGYALAGIMTVAVDGSVTATRPESLSALGSTLTLRTAPISIDPNGYLGAYRLGYASPDLAGPMTVVLVTGVPYRLDIAAYSSAGTFDVAADGSVTTSRPESATAAGATVQLRTTPVTIDPGIYAGPYRLGYATVNLSGRQVVTVVAGVAYRVEVAALGSAGAITVAGDGTVTATQPESVLASGATLRFQTAAVRIAPPTPGGFWSVAYVTTRSGPQLVGLVQAVRYLLSAQGANAEFTVASPCAVTPSTLTLAGGTYTLACGAAPVAVAGPDQAVVEGAAVALDGSATAGEFLTYAWTQVAGPPVALAGAATARPSFVAPQLAGGVGSQVLTFALTASNLAGRSTSTVNVTTLNVDTAPEAHAIGPANVAEGAPVLLSGATSFDPDGDPLTYEWVQTLGPAIPTSDPAAPELAFTAPLLQGGTGGPVALQFQLTVSDGQLSSTALVDVLVDQFDHPPVAVAGPAQTVLGGAAVTLDGAASADPDGDALGYAWTQVSGPAVALSDAAQAAPAFTAPTTAATLVFQLVVSDGVLVSAPAEVTVNVVPRTAPPDCSNARAEPALLWPPNHKLVPVAVAGLQAPEHGGLAVEITSVRQDEPTAGTDAGDTGPDAALRQGVLLLRSERDPRGGGRVYHVAFTATNADGAACQGEVLVAVPKSQKPGDTATDDGARFDAFR